MAPEALRAIAFIAAKLVADARGSSVYDYDAGKYVHFSGQVGRQVSVYDHDSGAHITGTDTRLFHHRLAAHISLSLNGNKFKGYDSGSGQHFQGTVRRQNVQLFDGSGFHHYFVT
jgi:hypothetical protein